MRRSGFWIPALACGALAVFLRVIYLVQSSANPFRTHLGLDMAGYDRWARAILQGQGLGEAPFTQAPLFPLLLSLTYAILGPDPVRALWMHLVPGALAVIFAAKAAGLWKGSVAAWGAGLLLALFKPAIFYTGVLLPPAWALGFASLVLYGTVRALLFPSSFHGGGFLLLGAGYGLLALAQPAALAALLPAAWWLWRGEQGERVGGGRDAREDLRGRTSRRLSRTRARIGWLATGTGAVLLLPFLYNGLAGGAWTPIAVNGGINLYIGVGPEANGAYVRPPGMREDRDLLGIEAARAAEGGAAAVPNATFGAAEADRFWRVRAAGHALAHPGRTLALYGRKLLFFFGQYEIPQVESLPFERRWSWLLKTPLPGMAFVTGLGLLGLLLLRRDPMARYLALSAAAIALGVSVFFVTARFRLPAVPFLALLGGGAMAELWGSGAAPGAGQRRRIGISIAAGATVAILLSLNLAGIDAEAGQGQYHFRLGVILEGERRIPEAVNEYARALQLDPTLGKAEVNLGTLLARAGRLPEARAHLERGVRLDPLSTVGQVNLGQLHQLEGRASEALAAYQAAVRIDPSNVAARENLAYLLYEAGRLDEARVELNATARLAPPGSPSALRSQGLLTLMEERRNLGREGAAASSLPLRRADLRLAQADVEEAARLYREAAAAPGGEEAARMLERLNAGR